MTFKTDSIFNLTPPFVKVSCVNRV